MSNEQHRSEPSLDVAMGLLRRFGIKPEESVLVSGSREQAEHSAMERSPTESAYGALPYFDTREQILRHFVDEVAYFHASYVPGDVKNPPWMDRSYGQGILLFELKFGERLSEFCEQVLAHYPDLGRQGSEISLFGLSGSGKSTLASLLVEQLGDDTIVIDSDTARYNLLAKKIMDVELAAGTSLETIRNTAMHNAISGPLYLALGHITHVLKQRGYTVVNSSTQPKVTADRLIYCEHPDGVDPTILLVDEDKRLAAAHTLFQRTEARLPQKDDYDWQHAETILDFRTMNDVHVRVPEFIHAVFIKNVGESLLRLKDTVEHFQNERIDDEQARHASLQKKLSILFS